MNQQTYQDQLYAEHQRANQAEYDNLVTSIALCQQESENAQYEYQQAVARGDYSAMAEAQRRMSRAEGRLAQLEGGKEALDGNQPSGSYPTQSQATQQYQQRPPTAMELINGMPGLSAKERQWLADSGLLSEQLPPQSRQANIARLHVERGIDRDSDAYFSHFNDRFGRSGNGRPQHPDMPKVSLTRHEAARISGISNEEYDKQARRLQELKRQGHYRGLIDARRC